MFKLREIILNKKNNFIKKYTFFHFCFQNFSTNLYKSVSIGSPVNLQELSRQATHTCSTLPGSNGGVVLDADGNFTKIHIRVANSRHSKSQEMFFNNETYNKYISVMLKSFSDFIDQSILTNINDDEIAQDWRSDQVRHYITPSLHFVFITKIRLHSELFLLVCFL